MRVVRVFFHNILMGALIGASLQLAAQSPGASNADAVKRADTAFRAGFAARQAGDLELARAKFAEVVRLQPGIAEGHEALGAVLFELGKTSEGLVQFEAAAKLKPGDDAIETNLALAYEHAGEAAKSIPHFERALSLSKQPGHVAISEGFLEAYGRALAAVGKPAEAIEQFLAAEALVGRRADLDDDIGSLYAQQRKWQEARERFEHAISMDATFVRARIHLGVLFREQHDLENSLATLQAACALGPPSAEAMLEYGRSLAAAGKDDDAILQFTRAMKLNPDLPAVQFELAMALQRGGRQQEAIPLFQKAVERDPHNASALTNLGLALALTGKGKEALEYFQRSLAVNSEDAVVYKDLGVAHIQLSAFDEAIEDFKKGLALDPNDPQLHYDLGLAYKFKDRLDEAVAELTLAGQMDPTLQDPPYTLGILLMQLGRLDEAVVELKKAVAMRPENGDAWAILGSTLKQDSRLPEAAEALKKAIPLLPGQPGPRVTLAGVLAEQAAALGTQAETAEAAGDQQKAAQLRAEMKGLRDQAADYRREGAVLARGAVSRQRANFAMNAGNQLMLRGQIADAISRYQESVAADPTFAEPHIQLAVAYERQGRAGEAAAERAKAAELGKAQ
jgi:protein O-GlcNAc transferase